MHVSRPQPPYFPGRRSSRWVVALALVPAFALSLLPPALAASPHADSRSWIASLRAMSPPDAGAPTPDPGAPEQEFAKEIAAAKALFELGVARYEAADYGAAIDLWVQANGALPLRASVRQMRAELNYNIATAQRKWFEVDQDVTHLRQAKITLERFASEIPDVYPPGEEADQESQHARELIDALTRDIQAAESRDEEKDKELARLKGSKLDEAARRREAKRSKALILTGSVLTGLGVAGLGVMGAGIGIAAQAERDIGALQAADQLQARRDMLDRGKAGNAMIVVGGIGGGVLLVAGISTLAAGLAGRARLQKMSSARLRVTPALGLGSASLVLSGRF